MHQQPFSYDLHQIPHLRMTEARFLNLAFSHQALKSQFYQRDKLETIYTLTLYLNESSNTSMK